MAGRKRSAVDTESAAEPRTTRSSKAAKTETSPKSKGGKRGPKASLAHSEFKAKALPLHVNITHTPPIAGGEDATEEKANGDAERVPLSAADPGAICSTTLLATTFGTGSYGWKGNKRVTIKLPNPNATGAEGEEETVNVMISINATVVGSKNAKENAGADEATEEATEETEEAAAEEAEPAKDEE